MSTSPQQTASVAASATSPASAYWLVRLAPSDSTVAR